MNEFRKDKDHIKIGYPEIANIRYDRAAAQITTSIQRAEQWFAIFPSKV